MRLISTMNDGLFTADPLCMVMPYAWLSYAWLAGHGWAACTAWPGYYWVVSCNRSLFLCARNLGVFLCSQISVVGGAKDGQHASDTTCSMSMACTLC